MKTSEVQAFSQHIESVEKCSRFTREDAQSKELSILDCVLHVKEGWDLSTEVYRKPTHIDHYLPFDFHQPLEHKLGVIRTPQHWPLMVRAESRKTFFEAL